MNSVIIIGRLTKDVDLKYTSGTQTAVATFNLALDRPKKNGEDSGADFPRVKVFGKQAENCEKYLSQGSMVGIQGHLNTGSYDKDGVKTYFTDVIADRVEFLSYGKKDKTEAKDEQIAYTEDPRDSFAALDEYIPF